MTFTTRTVTAVAVVAGFCLLTSPLSASATDLVSPTAPPTPGLVSPTAPAHGPRLTAVAPPQPAFQSPIAPTLGNEPPPMLVSPSLGNGAPVMLVSPDAVPTVTKANFTRLERAMTYSEVVAILGVEGQWRPADTASAVTTDTYVWPGTGGAPGATLTATFERGFLVEKTQHGLA